MSRSKRYRFIEIFIWHFSFERARSTESRSRISLLDAPQIQFLRWYSGWIMVHSVAWFIVYRYIAMGQMKHNVASSFGNLGFGKYHKLYRIYNINSIYPHRMNGAMYLHSQVPLPLLRFVSLPLLRHLFFYFCVVFWRFSYICDSITPNCTCKKWFSPFLQLSCSSFS